MRGRHMAPAVVDATRQAEDPAFALPVNDEVVFVPVNVPRLLWLCRREETGC